MRDDDTSPRPPRGHATPATPGVRDRRFLRVVLRVIAVAAVLVGIAAVMLGPRLYGDRVDRPTAASFYEQPAGAADGVPGSLVKTAELTGAPFGTRAWRIMYRTTDLNGAPQVSTGVLIVPLAPAPREGRTILSWAHPTTGAALDCAPSYGYDPFIGIEGMRSLIERGYAIVATDYIGMGTDGPDSYLVGVSGGNAVLDAARAARAMPEASAGDRVVLWGHSQGGQAVLFAAQRAATYAPDLHLVAVAAAAPAANLVGLMSAHLDDISGVTIGSYAFTSFSEIYPDAPLDGILTPAALSIVPEMNQLCLLTNLDRLHEIGQPLAGDFTVSDPTTTEPWATLLRENSVGASGFDAPLFVAQGTNDELVVPSDTTAFVDAERTLGVDVTYLQIPLATHSTVAYLSIPALQLWLERVDPR